MNTFADKLKILIILSLTVLSHFHLTATEKPAPKKNKNDLIYFMNRDRLHGRLITINQNNEVLWKYLNVKNFINFPLKNVDYIKLTPSPFSDQPQYNSTVSLTNGDVISGKIIAMDRKKLTFNTASAGLLKVPYFMVKEITHSSARNLVYSGPNPTDNWQQENQGDNNKWIIIKDGIMTIPPRYWAVLDVKLPPMAQIEYTVIAPRSRTQMQFFFYTKRGDEGYFLNQQGSYFELERMTETEGSDSIEDMEMPEALRKSEVKINIFIDKTKKRIILLFDGKLQGNYKDEYGAFAGKGSSIAVFNTGRIPVQIKQIKVTRWEGALPNEKAKLNFEDNDMVFFINKDKSSGKLTRIQNNTVFFTSNFGEFKIPLNRIKTLLTATKNQQLARRNKNDVQAFFPNQERITVNLQGIKGNKLLGTSENFGQAEFDLKCFSKLRFNIYKERPKPGSKEVDPWENWEDEPMRAGPAHAPRPQEKLEFLDVPEEEVEVEDIEVDDPIEIIE